MAQTKTPADWHVPLGVLILRCALAWFLFVWAVNKLLAPGQYKKIWGYFYNIEIDATLPAIMGSAQIIICLAIVLGFWRVVSYGLGLAMHTITIGVISASLMAPFLIEDGFPTNRNASVALAAWGGFAALWLLRNVDTWSLDVWLKNRRSAKVAADKS